MILITKENLETLLDGGLLFVAITNGRWWQARRNGKTQRWKTRPGHFRVPVKYGFRGYGELTHCDLGNNGALDSALFRHKDDVPLGVRRKAGLTP